MKVYHTVCGHEIKDFSLDLEHPNYEVICFGEMPQRAIEPTVKAIMHPEFCPKCGHKLYPNAIRITWMF